MNNLEKKIDLLASLALAEDDATRKTIKEALANELRGAAHVARKPVTVKEAVYEALQEIGVPVYLSGYDALHIAISLVVENPDIRHNIQGELYPEVANWCGSTIPRVERRMRHAVETAWIRGDLEVFQKYFGNTISPEKGKPTNGEFISQVANHIRRRMEEQ